MKKIFAKNFPPIQIRFCESNHQFHHTLYRSPGTHSLSYTRLHEPSITGIRDKIQVTSPKFLTWIHAKMFHPIPPLSDTDPRWSRVAKPVHSFPATCSSVPAQIPRDHLYWLLPIKGFLTRHERAQKNERVCHLFFQKMANLFLV